MVTAIQKSIFDLATANVLSGRLKMALLTLLKVIASALAVFGRSEYWIVGPFVSDRAVFELNRGFTLSIVERSETRSSGIQPQVKNSTATVVIAQ